MAHETHNDTNTERTKSQVSFKSSFWLIVILVGLFIAALNFINVMGHGEEGKEGKTEEMHSAKHEEAEHKEAKEEAKPEADHKEASKEEAKPAADAKHAPEHK